MQIAFPVDYLPDEFPFDLSVRFAAGPAWACREMDGRSRSIAARNNKVFENKRRASREMRACSESVTPVCAIVPTREIEMEVAC